MISADPRSEANDHFTQSEIDEMDTALRNAEHSGDGSYSSQRGFFGSSSNSGNDFISLLSQMPTVGNDFAAQARNLRAAASAQEQENARVSGSPDVNPTFDAVKIAAQIYPILEFRDKIVRAISNTISKIPGLENLLESISERLTIFILSLLAPFVRPLINQASKLLKEGSSGLIETSASSQFEPWNNPRCDNPTHSMLSKDHFTNILNSCAGRVAATIVAYVVPRVVYAWENPGVPVDEVVNDVLRALHHPAARDERVEIQREMFETVRKWTQETPYRHQLNHLLSAESVRNHKNHVLSSEMQQQLSASTSSRGVPGHGGCGHGLEGHGKPANSLWNQLKKQGQLSLQTENTRPSSTGTHGSAHSPVSMTGHAASYYSSATTSSPSPAYSSGAGYGSPHHVQSPTGYGHGHGHGQAAGYYHPQTSPPAGYYGQQQPAPYGGHHGYGQAPASPHGYYPPGPGHHGGYPGSPHHQGPPGGGWGYPRY